MRSAAPSHGPRILAARSAPAAVACTLAILASWCATARAGQAAAAPSIPGGWQMHTFSFQFMGFTSTYSCDGLADKLRLLLLQAGARKDVKSLPGACASPFGRPDRFARADLTFATLAPLPREAATDGKPVSGAWRSVSFARHSPHDLQLGDCEVVEQFRTQVLPTFTTRNVVNNTTCIPNQESGSTIDLQFEVFAPTAPVVRAGPA